jgi:hypothetical protein
MEPLIHSFVSDELPEDHPKAHERLICERCSRTIHASNNECMDAWVETGLGDFCLGCFAILYNENLEAGWALKR